MAIFGWGKGKSGPELLLELTQAQEEASNLARTQADQIATIEARNQEKQAWLEENTPKIQDKYLELVLCFMAGDSDQANRLVHGLGDFAPAVFSLPVLDDEGRKTDFKEWVETAFPGDPRNVPLTKKIFEAQNSDITPAFESTTAISSSFDAPQYQIPQKNMWAGVTGKYEKELQAAIAEITKEIEDKKRTFAQQEEQATQKGFDDAKNYLAGLAADMQAVFALLKLEGALAGNSDELGDGLKTFMPILIDKNGLADTINWFLGQDGDDSAPIKKLLEKSKYTITDPAHPLHQLLGFMPNDLAAANMLVHIADKADYPLMAKELKELAVEKTGDYLRVDNLSLFRPALVDHIASSPSNKFEYASFGKKEDVTLGDGIKAPLVDYLLINGFFILEDSEDLKKPEAVSKCFQDTIIKDGEKTIGLQTNYNGLTVFTPVGPADDEDAVRRTNRILDDYAQDSRFTVLQDKTVISNDAVSYAWIKQDPENKENLTVKYLLGGEISSITGIRDMRRAQEFLAAFSQTEESVRLSETEVIKADSIGNAWLVADKSQRGLFLLKTVIDGQISASSLPRQEALRKFEEVCQKGHLIQISENESINPKKISLIYYNAEKEQLKFIVSGKESETPMTKTAANECLARVERAMPSFVRHQRQGLLNIDHVDRVFFDREKNRIRYLTGNKPWQSSVSEKAAQALEDRLDGLPNYQRINNDVFVNLDRLSYLGYDGGKSKMKWVVNGAADDDKYYPSMDERQAQSVIGALEAGGRKKAAAALEKEFEGVTLEPYALPAEEAPRQQAPEPESPVAEPEPEEYDNPEELLKGLFEPAAGSKVSGGDSLESPASEEQASEHKGGGGYDFGDPATMPDVLGGARKNTTECTSDPAADPVIRRGEQFRL